MVEQAVRDPRLLGDVTHPGGVVAAAGEDPDGSVEDESSLLLARRLPIARRALLCD